MDFKFRQVCVGFAVLTPEDYLALTHCFIYKHTHSEGSWSKVKSLNIACIAASCAVLFAKIIGGGRPPWNTCGGEGGSMCSMDSCFAINTLYVPVHSQV